MEYQMGCRWEGSVCVPAHPEGQRAIARGFAGWGHAIVEKQGATGFWSSLSRWEAPGDLRVGAGLEHVDDGELLNRAATHAEGQCSKGQLPLFDPGPHEDGPTHSAVVGILRGRRANTQRIGLDASDRIRCPRLSGAISGNQHLKCPYLGEILDTLAQVFPIISTT
jgi:hypothetical protein